MGEGLAVTGKSSASKPLKSRGFPETRSRPQEKERLRGKTPTESPARSRVQPWRPSQAQTGVE